MVRKRRTEGPSGGESSEPQEGSGAQRQPAQQQQQGGYQGRGQGGGYQGRGQQGGYQGGQGGYQGGQGGYQGGQGGYQGGQPQGGRGWAQRGGHGGRGGGDPQQYAPRGAAPPQRRGGPGPQYSGGPSRTPVPELYQATQAPQQPVSTLQPATPGTPVEVHAESSSTKQMVDESADQLQQLSVQQEEPSQSVAPASSKSLRFPLRPGKGRIGESCIVKANHFFAELPDKDLHQYDVTINPEMTSRGVNRAVTAQLVNEWISAMFHF